jgi:hypothetical protein
VQIGFGVAVTPSETEPEAVGGCGD